MEERKNVTVVVAYKWAANPQDAAVDESGAVNWSRATMAVSEYDPVAIALGRRLATSIGTELVGASIGTSAVASSMAAKAVMSRGLDRGLVVADDTTSSWNATQVASALAALVKRLGSADLLLTGDASVDEGARSISALVAGFLGWVCFQDVVDVVAASDGWTVTQAVPGGTRTIAVRGPAVLAMTSDAVVPPVPGMRDILAASKKPFEVVSLAELDVPPVDLSVTGSVRPAPRARKHQVFTGAAADVVAEALAAMRADAAL
jgi:electron transfer flavoprotein beta subunit